MAEIFKPEKKQDNDYHRFLVRVDTMAKENNIFWGGPKNGLIHILVINKNTM